MTTAVENFGIQRIVELFKLQMYSRYNADHTGDVHNSTTDSM